jgi:acyl-CoA reductase-like NAD-dependent aldehyde dehydrogenase/uncharacterized protein YceH (UPF0502 family)
MRAMSAVTLTAEQARVLGCLMEKSVTTPDGYPLSLNSVVTACNQSTNRDPIVSYSDELVDRTLEQLREKGLSRRVMATGQRVVKHRHVAEEGLGINAGEFAVIGVLLLRGAQTPGELKGRTERWHRFRSLEDVQEVLDRLAARELTKQLPRRPGQKESRWAQLLTGDEVFDHAPAAPAASSVTAPSAPAAAAPPATAPEPERAPPVPHSLEIQDPATGTTVRTVAITEPGEIAQKVGRARTAQPAWAARDYEGRAGVLRVFRDLLATEAEECAQLTTQEMGKPIRQARAEVAAVLERVDWNIAHVGDVIAPRTVTAGDPAERVTFEPVGVVAHISAWNYPYFVGLNTIVPALLTGNAVLYKPSEHATLTGLRLVDLFHRAGVPVDVVHAVVGAGPTGAALLESDIDMVCFTGSHGTGQRVARAAADKLIRVQLELGGKDAAYVCDDVDIEGVAIDVAEGAFYNAGQSCSATERVYVHRDIWDRFVAVFTEVVQGYTIGAPTDDSTELGPLARPAQVDTLVAQIADAEQRGARVLVGGHRVDRPGNWFEATVLAGVDDTMALMRDESFGPVIGLAQVANDDEAIARMDDTEFGLGASVFTRDQARAERILARLDVGNAYWNTADRSCVRLPWAGRRNSGLGVSMSESGVRSFVREKAWHLFAS